MILKAIVCLCALHISLQSISQLQLAPQFTDNMVLQRNKPIKIFGKGAPGKTVSVSFTNFKSRVSVKEILSAYDI